MSAASIKATADKKRAAKVNSPTTNTSSGSSSKQVGLNQTQVNQLKGMSGIDQKALSAYQASGSVVGGKNNPTGTGRTNSNVITPASLTPTNPISLPNKPTPGYTAPITLTSNPALEAMGTSVVDNQYVYDPTKSESYNAVAESNKTGQTSLQTYLQSLQGIQPANQEADYLKREKQAGIQNLQSEVNNYTSQLNTIAKNAQAQNLSLEATGRGQTTTFIGGEQARVNREAAIASLPVSAQLDAAQGNLESATARLDKLWGIHKEDVQQEYTFKKGVIDAVFSYAEKSEQNILNAKLSDIKTKEATASANIARLQEWSKMAVQTGQSDLISQFTALDPKSATFDRDFGLIQSKVVDQSVALGLEAQRANIRQSNASAAASDRANRGPAKRDTQVVDGKLIDTQTGEIIADLSAGSKGSVLGNALAQQNINNINNIISSKGMDSAVGTSGLSKTSGGGLWGATKRFFSGALAGGAAGAIAGTPFAGVGAIPGAIIGALGTGTVNALRGSKDELTGDRQNFIGSVEQLRSQLTLDKLVQAKSQGATFGALSDGERVTLSAAATKLGTWAIKDGETVTGYNIDEKSFKKEMDVINNFAKLDSILKGVDPASVGAVVKEDNTIWVINSDGTYTQLH